MDLDLKSALGGALNKDVSRASEGGEWGSYRALKFHVDSKYLCGLLWRGRSVFSFEYPFFQHRKKQKPCFLLSLCHICDGSHGSLTLKALLTQHDRMGSNMEQSKGGALLAPTTYYCVCLGVFLNLFEPEFAWLEKNSRGCFEGWEQWSIGASGTWCQHSAWWNKTATITISWSLSLSLFHRKSVKIPDLSLAEPIGRTSAKET